ncbi:unnamed protein product [Phaedon cochleariae]|uniref:Uncharacterized protein n=1 Tax=Phaedon cochleariae TaxID=80249 RepID=A0A9P0GLR4_PHACE|nr:unnamed protein product [Phaedon cochleariae]
MEYEKNLDPETTRLQCANSAASPVTFQQNRSTFLSNPHQNVPSQEEQRPNQHNIQNSIILAKRYKAIGNEKPSTPPEGYIHDHYSPIPPRKLLRKSKSEESRNPRYGSSFQERSRNDNHTSTPIVDKTIKKPKLLHSILRKFDNTLGTKQAKDKRPTISETKAILLNKSEYQFIPKQIHLPDKNLSHTYLPADNSVTSNWPLQLTLRKHRDVSTQPEQIQTKERSSDPHRAKTKLSPPPEGVSSSKTVGDSYGNDDGDVNCFSDKSVASTKTLFAEGATKSSSFNFNMFRGGMKLKERFVVGLSVAAVLFTVLLVVDIQMDLGISGKHLVPSHGRIKYVVKEEGPESVYNRFRNRLLQKTHSAISTNISKETLPNETSILHNNGKYRSEEHPLSENENPGSKDGKGPALRDDFGDIVDYLALDSGERDKFREEIDRIHPVIGKRDEVKRRTIGEMKQLVLE